MKILKDIFKKNDKLDIKTITFYKFAYNIGAITTESIEDVKVETLLLDSFLFLIKKRVVTKEQEKNILVFKERYNQYLDYCIDKKFVREDLFLKADTLYLTKVPDMSHIQIPDISKELKEMEFDFENLGKIFSGLKK